MNTTSFVFTGDIGFDKYMDGKWNEEKFLDGEVLDFLRSGNHLVVNVEGAMALPREESETKGAASLIHSMNPEAAVFLERIGADIWNICNNHIMDAGSIGIYDTISIAKEHGVKTLGAGMNMNEASTPIIIDEAGGIGLLAVGYERACRKAGDNTPGCLNWSDMPIVEARIKEIKSKCKWCVIVAHDGEEFTALPSPYTRDRFLKYLEMGADVVVAHHPHVPMNYEQVGDKYIFYSLGNFVFDTDYQRSQHNTEKGLFVKLIFTENEVSFESFGIRIDREVGKIRKGDIPKIFVNVDEKEYNLLKALSAKMFIEATKRQVKYLKPGQYDNATEEDWKNNFYEPLRSGRVPGECLDFQIIYPLSLEASNEDWKDSKLTDVIKYIQNAM